LAEKDKYMGAVVKNIGTHPLHLGLGATAIPQPPFTGIDWYQGYGTRNGHDGVEGRLVSMHSFSESWDSWEMHPLGDEVVLCLNGSITLHQEHANGSTECVTIGPNEYAINPPGTWHTADIEGEATALFITAGMGTEHRPR
jgi:mannose-6-phosphate isomerase-like protein (cupin superfamily)